MQNSDRQIFKQIWHQKIQEAETEMHNLIIAPNFLYRRNISIFLSYGYIDGSQSLPVLNKQNENHAHIKYFESNF